MWKVEIAVLQCSMDRFIFLWGGGGGGGERGGGGGPCQANRKNVLEMTSVDWSTFLASSDQH